MRLERGQHLQPRGHERRHVGRGELADVRLLGGRSLIPAAPLGWTPSGSSLGTLFTPNPEDGLEPQRDVRQGAVVGVLGDSQPGRARWLFTPAPLYFALGGGASWIDLGLVAPVEELRFVELAFEAAAQGFSLKLDYDGHTSVDGEFRAPTVLVTPGVPDPYTGLRRHRDDLVARGAAPAAQPRDGAAWWREPIFCGWGAQCHLERVAGGLARDYATQQSYDGFLALLEEHAVRPGTIVVDDSWPHCLDTEAAMRRMAERQDILVAEAGTLRFSTPFEETVYAPPAFESGTEAFDSAFGRAGDPYELMGCELSSVLTATVQGAPETIGPVQLAHCVRQYDVLTGLGLRSASLYLDDRLLSPSLIELFRVRYGRPYLAAR
jgi:hypothetical protein